MTNTQVGKLGIALAAIHGELIAIREACERSEARLAPAVAAPEDCAAEDAQRDPLPDGLAYGPGVSGRGKRRGRKA